MPETDCFDTQPPTYHHTHGWPAGGWSAPPAAPGHSPPAGWDVTGRLWNGLWDRCFFSHVRSNTYKETVVKSYLPTKPPAPACTEAEAAAAPAACRRTAESQGHCAPPHKCNHRRRNRQDEARCSSWYLNQVPGKNERCYCERASAPGQRVSAAAEGPDCPVRTRSNPMNNESAYLIRHSGSHGRGCSQQLCDSSAHPPPLPL